MEVSRYIYQSPYPQSVQQGRPDASSSAQKEEQAATKEAQTKSQELEQQNPVSGIQNAEKEAQNITKQKLLDVYA